MAKANQRSLSGQRPHSISHEYKIPIRDRKAFMHTNKEKWVSEKKYKDYIRWKKSNR